MLNRLCIIKTVAIILLIQMGYSFSAQATFYDTSSRTPVGVDDVINKVADRYKNYSDIYSKRISEAKTQANINRHLLEFSSVVESGLSLCLLGNVQFDADRMNRIIKQRKERPSFEKVYVITDPQESRREIGVSISIQPSAPYDSIFTLFVNIFHCEG